jgi:hypothetical protein
MGQLHGKCHSAASNSYVAVVFLVGQIKLIVSLFSSVRLGRCLRENKYSLRNAQTEVSTQQFTRTGLSGPKIREVFFL